MKLIKYTRMEEFEVTKDFTTTQNHTFTKGELVYFFQQATPQIDKTEWDKDHMLCIFISGSGGYKMVLLPDDQNLLRNLKRTGKRGDSKSLVTFPPAGRYDLARTFSYKGKDILQGDSITIRKIEQDFKNKVIVYNVVYQKEGFAIEFSMNDYSAGTFTIKDFNASLLQERGCYTTSF